MPTLVQQALAALNQPGEDAVAVAVALLKQHEATMASHKHILYMALHGYHETVMHQADNATLRGAPRLAERFIEYAVKTTAAIDYLELP